LAGLLEEARKHYGFEAYLTLDKVGFALKNDLRKAAMDADKVNLKRKPHSWQSFPDFLRLLYTSLFLTSFWGSG